MTLVRHLLALAFLAPLAGVAHAGAPAPLKCVERLYGGKAVEDGGRWFLALPDGTRLPWDDGTDKTFDQKLDAPDLEDMFSQPYRAGAIRPITVENEDPGRIRVDALFKLAYPNAGLQKGSFLGNGVRVQQKIAPALERVAKRLASDPKLKPFLSALGGTYNDRVIAGTERKSAHAYGVAIDINPKLSDYWRWSKGGKWKNQIPQPIVDAFEAEGFIWGGRWYHFDSMHFEYRPELLDPACRP
jgi:hypothetical protein